jgi:hypothetical protein
LILFEAAPAPSNFNKVFPATGDQTFTLNNLVEKSTADAILILLPAYTGPAPLPFSLL